MPPITPSTAQQLPVLSFGNATSTDPVLPPFAKVIDHSLSSTTQQQPPLPNLAFPPPSVEEQTQFLEHNIQDAVKAVAKARKVAVVCGAGISCASGIPDFRSSEGLFNSLKQAHPSAKLSSGKDLFDASLFASEANAAIFYTMIAELRTMADNAAPTAFHRFLKTLDDEGKLFRVYTQNIDGLEEKAGLSYGLGNRVTPTTSNLTSKQPSPTPEAEMPDSTSSPIPFSFDNLLLAAESASTDGGEGTSQPPTRRRSPRSRSLSPPSTPSTPPSLPILEPLPPMASTSTASTTPRCIPLHGHLSTLSCPACHSTFPLSPFLPSLRQGYASACPACLSTDRARSALGERSRGIGRLKPDVVLYGENHKEGERVGEITRKDLMGARPDLLIVVGTSLKVPGTKLLVRELSKVIKPTVFKNEGGKGKGKGKAEESELEMPASSQVSVTSTASTSSRKAKAKSPPIHTIYLNFEFPKPSREFQGVFDVWLRGDVQEFVGMVEAERAEMEKRREERERRKVEQLEKERLKALGVIPTKGAKGKVAQVKNAAKATKAPAKVANAKKPATAKAKAPAGKNGKTPSTTKAKGKPTQGKLTAQFAASKASTAAGRKK